MKLTIAIAMTILATTISCDDGDRPIAELAAMRGTCISLKTPLYVLRMASARRSLYLDTTESSVDMTVKRLSAGTNLYVTEVRYESRLEYTFAQVYGSVPGLAEPVLASKVFETGWLLNVTRAVEAKTAMPDVQRALNRDLVTWCVTK